MFFIKYYLKWWFTVKLDASIKHESGQWKSFIFLSSITIFYFFSPSHSPIFPLLHSFSSMKFIIVIVNGSTIQQILYMVDHLFRKCARSCELPTDYWWKSTKIFHHIQHNDADNSVLGKFYEREKNTVIYYLSHTITFAIKFNGI